MTDITDQRVIIRLGRRFGSHCAYGKQRLIIQSQANRILELPEFKSSTMKGFLNKMESALRSMEEYAVDPENLAPLLVPFVEQKMPREILSKWREEIKSEDSFSTRRLISFLHERVECLPSNEPSLVHNQQGHTASKDVKPKTTALLTTGTKGKAESCTFCSKKGHTIDVCRSFMNRSKDEKENFIKSRKICFKCLEGGHWSQNCTHPKECEKCNKRHPTILHYDKPQPQPQKAKSSEEQKDSATSQGTKTSVSTLKTKEATLLKSFTTLAKGNGESRLIRALLDEGSQSTWVTQQTVDDLKIPIKGYGTFQVSVAFKQGYEPPGFDYHNR